MKRRGKLARLRALVVPLAVVVALTTSCGRSPEAKKARYLERGDRYFKHEQYREAVLEYRNALRIDGQNTRAVRQLALAHYELGDLTQSFRFLLKAQELEPNDGEIQLKLASVYLLGGRRDEARAQADRVLEKDPRNLEALIVLVGAATTPAEIEAGIRRLESVRGDLKNEARFHLALATLYGRKGDQAAAEREVQVAVVLQPNSPEVHLSMGEHYFQKGAMADAEREFRTAADLAPPGSTIQVTLADFYRSIGRVEESKRLLVDIATKAPDSVAAWRRLAEISLSEGRLDDAQQAIDRALKAKPGDLEAHLLRGRVFLARHDTTAAIQEFRTLLKAQPRFAPAHYQLGLAQLQAGDLAQAKAEIREAINIAPNFAEAILALARTNLQSGAVQPAVDDLERLLAQEPNLVAAHVLLGAAYVAQNKPAQVAAVARRLMTVAPQDPRGPDLLGVGLAGQGRRSEARAEFEHSLALAPGYLEPLNHLVALAVADKRLDVAINRVKQQIVLVPKSGAHEAILGNLYLAQGDAKLAEEALLKAIDLEPQLSGAYLTLGDIYVQARQYDRALAKINEAMKDNPKNPAPLVLAGIVYEIKGDFPKAREVYEKALALNPRHALAANNLAWIYSEYGGDKDKALQLAQTAKEQSPDDPRISDTLGWILYKRGVYRRALALLQEGAQRLPGNPQVQYHVGMAYRQAGDRDSARKALRLAVDSAEAFPGKEEARQALADLK